jgi:hypothetical protein
LGTLLRPLHNNNKAERGRSVSEQQAKASSMQKTYREERYSVAIFLTLLRNERRRNVKSGAVICEGAHTWLSPKTEGAGENAWKQGRETNRHAEANAQLDNNEAGKPARERLLASIPTSVKMFSSQNSRMNAS